jgi:hypothetical protein
MSESGTEKRARQTDLPLIVKVEYADDARRLREAIAFLLTYRRANGQTRTVDQASDQASESSSAARSSNH